MTLTSILKTLIPVTALMTGCASQMDAEPGTSAALRDIDLHDTDGELGKKTAAAVPAEETYCDTEYLRTHPNADCDDYGIDRDQMTGGR